ncbi:Dual specificity protein kinase CLK3 [Lemmus lemmus]
MKIDYHTHPKGSLPQGDHGPEAMNAYPTRGDTANTVTAIHIVVKSRAHPLERPAMGLHVSQCDVRWSRERGAYCTGKQAHHCHKCHTRSCSTISSRSQESSKCSSQSVEDDKEGYLLGRICNWLQEQYEIVGNLGKGTFSKVVEFWDHTRGKSQVVLKIIPNVGKYPAACQEINDLKKIKKDQENMFLCVLISDWFNFWGPMCITFELLGKNIFEFLKEKNFHPYPLPQVWQHDHQLCHALRFLHESQLTHTDLKPENILFVNS